MMLRFSLLALLATSTASLQLPTGDIPASSRLGSRLLSSARRVEQEDEEVDFTWVAGYSIRFDSCHTITEWSEEAQGGNSADEDAAPTETRRLVHFKLCPEGTCEGSCKNGADYLVEMRDFVESYLEFDMNAKEYNCEQVKENCACDDDQVDDETCEANCYAEAGLDYCEEDEDEEEFDIEQFLECEQVNEDNEYYAPLYVGAYCGKNGKSIHLGTFSDRQCSQHTDSSEYTSYTGMELPYMSESIISNDCLSCKEPEEYDENNNGDQEDEDEVIEMCEELYEQSAKCERHLKDVDVTYTGGCDYIFKTLPQAERATTGGASAAVVFAWLFGVSTLIFALYAFFLYRRVKENSQQPLIE